MENHERHQDIQSLGKDLNLGSSKCKAGLLLTQMWCLFRHSGIMHVTDREDKMATSYSLIHHMWNWLKKLFFDLLDLIILNSYIRPSSCCGPETSHREINLYLVRNTLAHAVKQPCPQRMLGRPVNDVIRTGRLGTIVSIVLFQSNNCQFLNIQIVS